ncbi:hypothetical protein EGI22_15290 [Lacihabitans sp. LS3-19]|nr:hypothetical protein [Lacihabitans sp. LS3-19]
MTASGGTTYAWTGPNSFVSTDQNPSITSATVAMSGNYMVTVTDANLCVSTAELAVTVNTCGLPQPSPIVGSNVACQGRDSLVYYVDLVPGATSYTWTYSGNGLTFHQGISNTRIITINFSFAATSGTLTVVANNSQGSSLPSSMNITVFAAPSSPSASGITIPSGSKGIINASGCTTYRWYQQPLLGASIFAGASFTTSALDASKTYYIACKNEASCESPRTQVQVNVPCSSSNSISTNYSAGDNLIPKASASNGLITATNKVENTAKITYQSKAILLDVGFKAEPAAGGYFKAEIGGCN